MTRELLMRRLSCDSRAKSRTSTRRRIEPPLGDRMFKSHLIVSAANCAFVLATVAARAEPLPSLGCYARAYDKAHLSAHKNQIVDKAWLSIETRKDTPPYPFLATLQFSTKGRSMATFSTFGACKEDRGALLCNASLSAEETDLCKAKNDGVRHCRIGYDNVRGVPDRRAARGRARDGRRAAGNAGARCGRAPQLSLSEPGQCGEPRLSAPADGCESLRVAAARLCNFKRVCP